MSDLEKTLLAVLFASGDPVSPERLAPALEIEPAEARALLEQLGRRLAEEKSPLQVLRLGGEYQLSTREEYTPVIRRALAEKRNVPLSQAALEVLAAVAYNQPVTRAYVEQVRGVDSSAVISSLTEKGLLEEAGRLELPGRPIAYRTTAHFLRTFGLSSLDELPVSAGEDETETEPGEDVLDGQVSFDG